MNKETWRQPKRIWRTKRC